MEAGSGKVWRLVPDAGQELKRRQRRWQHGGDIPEGVAAGEGMETRSWELQPHSRAGVEMGVGVLAVSSSGEVGTGADCQWKVELHFQDLQAFYVHPSR